MPRLSVAILMSLASTAFALAGEVHEPAKDSAERAAILDAIRPAIEAQMGGPVEFNIETMRTDGDWAFVIADPQRPGGKPIDPETTAFADREDEMDGLTILALARFVEGRWVHIDDIAGPMDAAQVDWIKSYRVPESIINGRE